MGVVSGRIDDDDEKVLKEADVNLSELFRTAARERARRLRQERALGWLIQNAADVKTRSEDIVREGRDA